MDEDLVLFDLFDFNQIHTLSLLDFQFLLHSCFCGAAKLFSIMIEIPETESAEIVGSSFPDGIRLTLNQVLRWMS